MLAPPTHTFLYLTGGVDLCCRESTGLTTLPSIPPPSQTHTHTRLGLSAIYYYIFNFSFLHLATMTDMQAACTPFWIAGTFFSLDEDAKAQINTTFRATKKKEHTCTKKYIRTFHVCERSLLCDSGENCMVHVFFFSMKSIKKT